jgi:uncharacterized protein
MTLPESITLASLVYIFGVMFASGLLVGSVGYGMNLIAGPLLILIEPGIVPGPLLVAGLVISILMALRERNSIDIWGLKWALAGRIPASFGAAALLAILPLATFKLVFAGLVILAVVLSLSGLRFPHSRTSHIGAGLLSGIMGTIAAIGSPPVALLYQHDKGSRIRATIGGYGLVSTLTSMLFLAAFGEFSLPEINLSLMIIPGAVTGFLLSSRFTPILDKGYTRPAVLATAVLAAVIAVLQTLL